MSKAVTALLELFSFILHVISLIFNPSGSNVCPASSKPLMLTPHILSNQTAYARKLSRVDGSCLEDFVPPSHSGYITVNQTLGNHLFFWYFPSPTNTSAPLLVWLNGGPGISSMQGLLYQNGPLKIEDGKPHYIHRKHSLVGPFSVVYIDNPVWVGYSYSDTRGRFRTNMLEYGSDLYEFMEQFVQLFPQYQEDNAVYIGGQSYAGKYIPVLGSRIHRAKLDGTSRINLIGLYLAGPLFDPETNFEYINEYFYSMGAISYKMLKEQRQRTREDFVLFKNGSLANETMNVLLKRLLPLELPGTIDNYVTDDKYSTLAMRVVMTSSKIRNALHVGEDTNYDAFNYVLFDQMVADVRNSVKENLALLMDNYKVLIYNGDYDVMTNTNTIEAGLLATEWEGRQAYEDALRFPWKHNGKIVGYYSSVGRFCRAVIHGAGHQVGMDQPEATLLLMKGFVRHGCVS